MKHVSIIFFTLILMFSISAVCATNETADVTQTHDTPIVPEEISDSGDNGNPIVVPIENISYSDSSQHNNGNNYQGSSSNIGYVDDQSHSPVLSVSLDYDENVVPNNYVDVSIDYNNNTFDINNKNYYFTVSQNDNSVNHEDGANDAKSHNLVSVFTSTKDNNMLLNVNFLNVSNQTVNLLDSNNLIAMLWNMIISFFNSLFR